MSVTGKPVDTASAINLLFIFIQFIPGRLLPIQA